LRGIEYDGFDRSTDILVSRLRKKLSLKLESQQIIKTVWGKGYLFSPETW
jgi:DNA-binding response OmpR family regulator